MSIVIFIITIAILIIAHEFGHFIAAKRAGIRVDEFGIGFPPRLFSWRRGETLYSVNAIPFGGFVKIFGEDGEELNSADVGRQFVSKSKLTQARVIVAGVAFNFLVGWLLFSAAFIMGLPMGVSEIPAGAAVKDRHVLIAYVEEGTPAHTAGLETGDILRTLTTASGETLSSDTLNGFKDFIAARAGEPLTVRYERDGKEKELTITPREGIVPDRAAIGIAMDDIGVVSYPLHRAFFEGAKTTVDVSVGTLAAFASLIRDALVGEADVSNLTGPIGIVSLTGKAAAVGFSFLVWFVALISVNLGVLNLLPVPGLDGGRLAQIGIEALRGAPLKARSVAISHMAGFALLILLMLFVTYHDIVRLLG